MIWRRIACRARHLGQTLIEWLCMPVHVGRHPGSLPEKGLILFPLEPNRICCGLAGIVAFKTGAAAPAPLDLDPLARAAEHVAAARLASDNDPQELNTGYLGAAAGIDALRTAIQGLKQSEAFYRILTEPDIRVGLENLKNRLDRWARQEDQALTGLAGRMAVGAVDRITRRIEQLKDAAWSLDREILAGIEQVRRLVPQDAPLPGPGAVGLYQHLNIVLNGIDRLEVRGRDSAGVSILFELDPAVFHSFGRTLAADRLDAAFARRQSQDLLLSGTISLNPAAGTDGAARIGMAFTYKVAAEIGRLGDNVADLRRQIHDDPILHRLMGLPYCHASISAHTRWASVGAITEANCHPVDNGIAGRPAGAGGIVHACLNGDIDNYLALRQDSEKRYGPIPPAISSDTKIIPLRIGHYLNQGLAIEEAFRRAVGDFEGSHAIAMHTDLAPGRLFLAQRGSGQAIFVGLAPQMYLATSEVYGLVEVTDRYIKIKGENQGSESDAPGQGQIFILSSDAGGGLAGIRAMGYDGRPVTLTEADIKQTPITTRDVDRQGFAHYFLKEINEAPSSVAQTLHNRWKLDPRRPDCYTVALDEQTFPAAVSRALADERIRRIFYIGQGTAGVAAQTCADILKHHLDDPGLTVTAMKASELSGFHLGRDPHPKGLSDTLIIAISQSGTTTDTNRAVDMARARGAVTLAIVNRRESDLTFKVDGVVYTSSGRDIEMSVASTKAFYAQIVAGSLLALHIAALRGRRDEAYITREIDQLLGLPAKMRVILDMQPQFEASARRLAAAKTYWAVVGSGPNKAAADEIRIKLSELCYKTISSDFVEDKKHIDLSSEPLIIVCAAGTRPGVLGDIVKDTAIFNAHKATPVVFCDESEYRFDPYAADVLRIPSLPEHLAPIANTLAGHLWGYGAALAINEGSRFLYEFRQDVSRIVGRCGDQGMDVYEIVLEKSFREKIVAFYREFRNRPGLSASFLTMAGASNLTLLLKYLAGRLPVPDFEVDFGIKGTARNMLDALFTQLAEAINLMARPVDAIKHQAKTVTVGTSRLPERLDGLLFETLAAHRLDVSRLTNRNILVIRNLQPIVARIEGAIVYRLRDLNLLGEPTEATTIEVVDKQGVLRPIASRVESDPRLQGTKRIIAREGNVYIGKGRKDDRSIIVIPVLSGSAETPYAIEHLLLLNIAFRTDVSREDKAKALGGKLERNQEHRAGKQHRLAGRISRSGAHRGTFRPVGGKDRRADRGDGGGLTIRCALA